MDAITPLFHTSVSPAEMNVVLDVLESGKFVMGSRVEAFEQALNEYFGDGGVATCASGTDALVLALQTLPARMGVVVPAMTFSATYEAVLRAGLKPVVCDVDEHTLTPSVDQVRDAIVKALTSGIGVSCVIVVNLYGWPAYDLGKIAELCRSQNIFMIEDCAQSFGAMDHNVKVGMFGDAAAYSFYPTKPLGGIGDGGAVWFKDRSKADSARIRRDHGRDHGVQVSAGYNSRLDETNAAILRHRLLRHQDNITRRREISGYYHVNGLKKMAVLRRGTGVPYVYPILVDNREQLMFKLADIGIQTRVHYDPPVSDLPYVKAACPNAQWAAKRVLSLPCHQSVTETDVNRICDVVRETTTVSL